MRTRVAGAICVIGLSAVVWACIPSPNPTRVQELWESCQSTEADCAQRLAQTVSIDEASFVRASSEPEPGRGPVVRKILDRGVWSFARTALAPWSFTDAELEKSELKRFFFPPLWKDIVRDAQRTGKQFRQALFEWVFQFIGDIVYAYNTDPEMVARYDYLGNRRLGQILLTQKIPKEVQSGQPLSAGVYASNILLHEGTHGAATFHGNCTSGPPSAACDSTLNGPFGMEILYIMAAIRAENKHPHPDTTAVTALTHTACTLLHSAINNLPQVYTEILPPWNKNCSFQDLPTWFLRLDRALSN